MSLIERVKGIIISPVTEWQTIQSESTAVSSLLSKYVLPLSAISAVAAFIGQGFIGTSFMGVHVGGTITYGLYSGVLILIQSIISFYLTTHVVDLLAPNFQSEKNIDKSAQLVAYSSTPSLVGGILSVYPPLATVGALFGLYSLYLIYIGLPIMENTPADKRIGYVVVTILLLVIIYIVIGSLLGTVLMSLSDISPMSLFNSLG